jgi:hypothetical protein
MTKYTIFVACLILNLGNCIVSLMAGAYFIAIFTAIMAAICYINMKGI